MEENLEINNTTEISPLKKWLNKYIPYYWFAVCLFITIIVPYNLFVNIDLMLSKNAFYWLIAVITLISIFKSRLLNLLDEITEIKYGDCSIKREPLIKECVEKESSKISKSEPSAIDGHLVQELNVFTPLVWQLIFILNEHRTLNKSELIEKATAEIFCKITEYRIETRKGALAQISLCKKIENNLRLVYPCLKLFKLIDENGKQDISLSTRGEELIRFIGKEKINVQSELFWVFYYP